MVAQRGLRMITFTVELDNQPGELTPRQALASNGVNLLLCATTHVDSGCH
jgi:hypothetical protein